nr:putative late blight resistance protein homolog R1B-16 isoform X3 [Ipomoea trifida]
MFDTPSVVLEYLQTLYWLHPSQCTKEVFLGIRNAKVMGIFMPRRVRKFVQGLISSDDEYSLAENWLDDLINLQKLEKLKLNSDHEDPIILPHASAFPVQLKMLTLKGTSLPWDAMEVIGTVEMLIPNLKQCHQNGQNQNLLNMEFWHSLKSCFHENSSKEKPSILLHKIHGHIFSLVATIVEEKEQVKRGKFDEQEHEKVATIIEEKEHENRGQQECKKLKYKASYPDSSYFARQVQEEEDSKLTNVNFYNCFEDDFDDNDIN